MLFYVHINEAILKVFGVFGEPVSAFAMSRPFNVWQDVKFWCQCPRDFVAWMVSTQDFVS